MKFPPITIQRNVVVVDVVAVVAIVAIAAVVADVVKAKLEDEPES